MHPGIIQCQSWKAELNHHKIVRIKGIFEHKKQKIEFKDDFLSNEIEILLFDSIKPARNKTFVIGP